MGKIEVTGKTLAVAFTYENGDVTVTGTMNKDTETGELTQVSATINKADGDTQRYIGHLNGQRRNGEMQYSYGNQMCTADAKKVLAAAEEIEKFEV